MMKKSPSNVFCVDLAFLNDRSKMFLQNPLDGCELETTTTRPKKT